MEHEPESLGSGGASRRRHAPTLRAGAARPRSAPRRGPGRARALLVGAAVCAAIAGGALLAGGTIVGAGAAPSSDAAEPALSADEIDTILMPITAADARASMRLYGFQSAVARSATSACTGNAPIAEPTPIPADARLHLFEDPVALRASGLGITSNVRSGAPAPSTAPDSFECASAGREAVAPIESVVAPVRDAWIRAIRSSEQSASVQAAWAGWSACMKGAGYALDNEDAFNRLVDSRMRDLIGAGDLETARAEELTLARAFADCLGGVVDARMQVRAEARQDLIRTRSADVATARSQLNDAIRDVGREHGVTFR